MLIYPQINPVAFHIGPLEVHWYGIMYLLGFSLAWLLAWKRARKAFSRWTTQQVYDLIFFCAIGVIVGGRLGYMLFYDFAEFMANPLVLFKIWGGGMSFHGGLIGVTIAVWLYARRNHKSFFEVGDFTAPLVPLGLAAGRIGNFINGELWGQVTQVPWGMVYPGLDQRPRHPSVLYEFCLEGIVLFIILWLFSAKPRPVRSVSGLFLICYGIFRIFVEFFRQPDPQLGFIAFGWLTMGQLLSLPMIAFGVLLMVLAYRQRAPIISLSRDSR
jgi:phosphatidylglycerol:prolipoprotein diacylglycerol transferase